MTNFQIPFSVYVAGAIFGGVLMIVSLVTLFIQPTNVAQYAQNNVAQPQLLKSYTGMGGGYVWVTPTPCVVSGYEVNVDSCTAR